MPGKARTGKVRSSSSAKKRIKRTGKGQFARQKAARNHLLQQKSKRQRRLAHQTMIMKGYGKTIKRMLPSK
jgi:ribosomal protein L35